MRVVPTVWLQTKLPVHEDHGVPGIDKVLCGRGPACAGAEVVQKADGVLLKGDGGPA